MTRPKPSPDLILIRQRQPPIAPHHHNVLESRSVALTDRDCRQIRTLTPGQSASRAETHKKPLGLTRAFAIRIRPAPELADRLVDVEINAELVRRLIAEQFPEWSGLRITPVRQQGNDNRTFRVGDDLAVGPPSHESYSAGITKEDRFLPLLGDHLTVGVPTPVATGRPTREYPYPWSVRRWMIGDTPDRDPYLDRDRFARDLGAFLRELRAVPADDGPVAGLHSFYRGCHPSVYGDQVQAALRKFADHVDVAACKAIWLNAVRSVWSSPPVWVHGDVAVGNLLTAKGQLSAVIDFGTCALGDPACDLVIAWTFLEGDEREALRGAAGLPADAWARARGWALWKALITMTDADSPQHQSQANALAQLLGEPGGV